MKNIKQFLFYNFLTIKKFIIIVPFASFGIFICYIVSVFYKVFITYISNIIFKYALLINNSNFYINLLKHYIIIFLIAFAIKSIFDMLINIPRMVGIYTKSKYIFERELALHLVNIPFIYFDNIFEMEKIERVKNVIDKNIIQRFFLNLLDILFGLFSIFGIITILANYNAILIPISILSVIPFYISKIIRGNEFYQLQWYQSKYRREALDLWGIFLKRNYVQELKINDSYNYIYEKWKKVAGNMYNDEKKFRKKDAKSLLLCNLIRIIGLFFNIILTIILVRNGNIKINEFAACLTGFTMIQFSFREVLIKISEQSVNINYIKDFFGLFETKSELNGHIIIKNLDKEIKIEELTFSYPNTNKNAINNISFNINYGERIALIGENGCGKTTLTNLLLNMYKPKSGYIKIGSETLDKYNLIELYKKIAVLPQNFTRYNMSVSDNVSIVDNSNNNNNKERIENILSNVGLNFLCGEERINELLGKNFGGKELSGGEWQKIAIARVIYKNSDLIILDEPTSSLDPVSESSILRNFLQLVNNKTAIIVSHRIGICRYVDKIIVMKKGDIIGIGNHDYLYKNNDYYRYLYNEQQKWYI